MKARSLSAPSLLLAALLIESSALASEDPHQPPLGVEASIGGGLVGFTQKVPSEVTRIGASWTLRLVVGTRSYLSGELAYVGTAQSITMAGIEDGSLLMSRGVEAALRFNLIDLGRWQPYTFAGVAYRLYDVVGGVFEEAAAQRSDTVVEAPVGGGLAFRYDGFVADARLEFRAAFNDELMAGKDRSNNALHSWGANARIGWEL